MSHHHLETISPNLVPPRFFRGAVLINCALLAWAVHVRAADCVLVPSGIMAWWGGEGDARDYVALNDGALKNGTTVTNGLVGRGLDFHGQPDYVEVPFTSDLKLTSEFTVEAWILARNLEDGTIASQYDTTARQASWVFRVVREGYLRLGAYQGTSARNSGRTVDTLSPVIVPGAWMHVAGTINLSEQRLTIYVNGVSVPLAQGESAVFTNFFPSSVPIRLGTFVNDGGSLIAFFNGILDEVSLYNRALSEAEILAVYGAGSSGKCRILPRMSLLSQWSATPIDTCLPLSFLLQATNLNGPHRLTAVEYFDGPDLIGRSTSETNEWRSSSVPLNYGLHSVRAEGIDRFGLRASSASSLLTLKRPDVLVMHANLATDGQIVCCMGTESGNDYIFEASPWVHGTVTWEPFATNHALSELLSFTNSPLSSPMRYFRGVQQ